MSVRKRLQSFVTHPVTQLLVGLCMVLSGLSELAEALDGALLSSAHGVVVYGLLQSAKAVIELVEGLEKVDAEAEVEVGIAVPEVVVVKATAEGSQE